MFDQNAILDANDVRRDPAHGKAEIRESPVHDHEIPLGRDRSWLIFERWRKALDEIEETFTSRRDVSAVLDVVGRPKLLSSGVVALVKQRVKGFEDKLLILRFYLPVHHFHFCHLPYLLFIQAIPADAELAPSPQSFEPPSTGILAPVILRDASDARTATTSATSSGLPIRFKACIPRTAFRPASVFKKLDMSVSISPGATAFTRMPRGPRIPAQYFTRVSSAPLVAA